MVATLLTQALKRRALQAVKGSPSAWEKCQVLRQLARERAFHYGMVLRKATLWQLATTSF